MTTSGVLTTYTDPSINAPEEISAGPYGSFCGSPISTAARLVVLQRPAWFRATGNSELVHPYAITADSDGALWFTYQDWIGRITTAGVITNLFVVPDIDEGSLTTTSDGSLWFIDNDGNVDQMTPSGVVTHS